MHFIHEINWFEWLLHKTSFFFKNFNFPDFRSVECIFWFDQKYVKKFGLNLLGSIGARSIECIFRLIEPQFRLIEIQKLSLLKSFTFTCSSLFQKVLDFFSLSHFDRSNLRDFCFFLPQISPRFLFSSIGKTFIPFLFQFNYMFHAFFFKIFEHRKFGIFIFRLFLNIFDH